jgi:hypothetical protein
MTFTGKEVPGTRCAETSHYLPRSSSQIFMSQDHSDGETSESDEEDSPTEGGGESLGALLCFLKPSGFEKKEEKRLIENKDGRENWLCVFGDGLFDRAGGGRKRGGMKSMKSMEREDEKKVPGMT